MLEEALDIALRIESVESTQRLLDTRSSSRSESFLTISEGDPSSDDASVQYVGAANTQLARLQKQLEQLTYEIQQIKIDKHKPPGYLVPWYAGIVKSPATLDGIVRIDSLTAILL